MSSARSRWEKSSVREEGGLIRHPVRMPYGMRQRRHSRNMAALGMFGMMTCVLVLGLALHRTQSLSLPALQMRRIVLVQPQFRFVPREKPEMRKILAEDSEFRIPEEPAPEAPPEPEKITLPEPRPEVRPEPEPEAKPEPKPEIKPEPKPEIKPEEKPKPKAEAPRPARRKAAPQPATAEAEADSEGESASGNAAVSVPAAVGSRDAENSRRSAVLAAILQAVEKYKRYPRQGRRSGAEGSCTLVVQVGSNGRVASCTLADLSGKSVLDAAARELGERLVGLDVGSAGSIRVSVPVHYRLTDR